MDLTLHTLPKLRNMVPEKWEGLAIGPRLKDGGYVMVAGTDNDYSVTQNAGNVQFDVYFRMADPNPSGTFIYCPVGHAEGCFFHDMDGNPTTSATLSSDYTLLPGVLQAYKVSAADLGDFVRPGRQGKGDDDGDRDEDESSTDD